MQTTPSQFYLSILSKTYWKAAADTAKQLRILVVAAMLVALRVAIASMYIPVGEELQITFGFFFNAFGSYIYGPVLAPFTGFASDIIGFTLKPTGVFFPGYTLTAMAGSLSYALFLYRKRITMARLFFTKAFVNIFVNVGMNSLWSAILYSRGFYYYFTTRLLKNIVMLPIEFVILVLFFKAMMPVAAQLNLIRGQDGNRIPIW